MIKKKIFGLALAAVTVSSSIALLPPSVFAQAISVNGGAIQGTITDPSGAVVGNAQISITSAQTGFKRDLTTDKSGFYSVGPLNPGPYTVTISAAGFQNLSISTVVRTGTATPGSFKLSIGASSTEVSVEAGAVQVNADQGGVSDVITKEQINSLPINGRNFLDIAQIEPGVILQSGESFDPTKAGYSAISISGVSGRTTRILLDGQDITDETVGTTIFNVSQGAINEFQLNRSTQDVSGDVTSTGQVLVSTNSGTNAIHGQLFYNFQDYRALFATGGASNPPFQRNQFGGSVGGPIIKDKLFFFGNAERLKQASSQQVSLSPLFAGIQAANPAVGTPAKDTYSTIRLDYNGPKGIHFFARANYEVNSFAGNFGDGYQLYANRDNAPGLAGGADFTTGRYTHSFRGSYEKFHNLLGDTSRPYDPLPNITFQYVAAGLYTGPNDNAPQGTFQSDKQFRYDGTATFGRHNIRYGYSLNRIQGGGFASFFALAPRIRTTSGRLIAGRSGNDPFNDYRPSSILFANGQGFFTENTGFGLPAGATSDWREGAYLADTWKITPKFTLISGIRWSVDTGRANQDIPSIPCSQINAATFTANGDPLPCTGSTDLFSVFDPVAKGPVHQPYGNFGPQLGFAYAVDSKTVLRGAAGIFFENDVFNNTTNARANLLPQGRLFDYRSVCASGRYTLPDGTVVTTATAGGSTLSISAVCNLSVRQAAPYALSMQSNFVAATTKNPLVPNGGYIGNNLTVNGLYAGPYRTPYAEQFNFGIQREIFKGAVLSADYVHNATLKIGQNVDLNHVGASRYFNRTAALNAIAATAANYPACAAALTPQSQVACAIQNGAQITDFAGNGLDSGNQYLGGNPAEYNGLNVANGAAFPGRNALLGNGSFTLPTGKAGYDALQMVFRQVKSHPFAYVDSTNLQVSYSYSRAVATTTGGAGGSTSDSFFSGTSWDNDNPGFIIGRSGLDHTHQINFGGSAQIKYGLHVGLIGHFYSAPPTSLTLDTGALPGGAASIFQTDLNGDGTSADLAPGTKPGSYQHDIKGSNISNYVTQFNQTYANTLTPAGQALVSNGLFTQAQLVAANGAIRPLATPNNPRQSTNNPAFRSLDASVGYPIPLARYRDGLSLEPSIAFYNVGNFSNFGSLGGILTNIDDGQISASGVNNNPSTRTGPNTFGVQNGLRTPRGTGTFSQGTPRTTEFQLKLNF